MRFSLRIFMLALAPIVASASTTQAGFSAIAHVTLNGATGNPILNGQSANVTYTTFAYGYNTSQLSDYINGSPSFLSFLLVTPGQSNFSILDFASNELNTPLVPGTYSNAERASFAAAGYSGLDVSYAGAGSNMLTGSFTITTLTYFNDPANGNALEVASFAASFTQYTDGNPNALTGTLTYQNLAAAVPEPASLSLLGMALVALTSKKMRRKLGWRAA